MKRIFVFPVLLLSMAPCFAAATKTACEPHFASEAVVDRLDCSADHPTRGGINFVITSADVTLNLNAGGNLTNQGAIKTAVRNKYQAILAQIDAEDAAAAAASANLKTWRDKITLTVTPADIN